MRYCSLLLIPMLMLSAAASAQSTAPMMSHASDQWKSPATTSTAATGFRSPVGKDSAATKSHFKFKSKGDGSRYLDNQNKPWDEPPPSAHDKAAVMGADRGWSNGRPPVDCAQTPMDAACH